MFDLPGEPHTPYPKLIATPRMEGSENAPLVPARSERRHGPSNIPSAQGTPPPGWAAVPSLQLVIYGEPRQNLQNQPTKLNILEAKNQENLNTDR